jgi:hypothetical protein
VSRRDIRTDVAAFMRANPRFQIGLIAVLAFGLLICMVGVVIVLAITQS